MLNQRGWCLKYSGIWKVAFSKLYHFIISKNALSSPNRKSLLGLVYESSQDSSGYGLHC